MKKNYRSFYLFKVIGWQINMFDDFESKMQRNLINFNGYNICNGAYSSC